MGLNMKCQENTVIEPNDVKEKYNLKAISGKQTFIFTPEEKVLNSPERNQREC